VTDGATAEVSNTEVVTQAELEDLVAAALEAAGAGEMSAQATAHALVQAEIDGQSGHGLSRVESYAAQLLTGKVDGTATPHVSRPRPSVVSVDVANGFFYPAFDTAVGPVVEAARSNGIAAAAFTRSHHAGALGLVVERFAEEGFVALLFANTPTAMTAWGGRTPLFGTNPIAFAAPSPDAPPIVVDLALSKVARGKILTASRKGEPIPDGWAKDADGNPTTDAAAAMAGTLEPIGGAKGAALALMVEVLAAALVGANLSSGATSFFDGEGDPPGVGQLLIVIDPEAFGGPAVAEKIGQLVDAISADEGTRVPGRAKHARRTVAEANGIAVSLSILARLRAMADPLD
jgi:(2R)-3-sulfolactate dehydrogenase (NADP+)